MILRERAAKHDDLPKEKLPTCLAVATPACTTQDLALACQQFVTSLVCQVDSVTAKSTETLSKASIIAMQP